MKTTYHEPGEPGRILVADDEPLNRELLHDLLEANGYAVVEAEDGVTALTKVKAEKCDVVLLDVLMPGMDGLEVCRQLKADPETAHIPVLMVTALAEREQRNLGIDAGANDYLAKPIDRRDVLLRVRNAVHAKRLYDKVQQDLAKLRELEALQDNLTHMIIHDMRSPLMVISWSYDFLMKEQSLLSSKQQEFIMMGRNCCSELLEMTSSLLDVSRMEAGQMKLNRIPCDLCDIARKAVSSVAVMAQKQKVNLQVDGCVAIVMVDRDILHRVFINLLTNAIKVAPVDSTIGITITAERGVLRASVSDQGPGIALKHQQKIFEKFGQVDSRKKEQNSSFGLGLTFCKLAVEAHGGEIGVESPSLSSKSGEGGKGSTFWFSIPPNEPGDGCGKDQS